MKKNILIPGIFIAWFFAGCSGTPPADDEALIRNLIDDARALAEQKKINELMDLTTEGLTVDPGQRDRRAAKATLFAAFRFYGAFHINYPRPMVSVNDAKTHGEATIPFVIIKQGAAFPDLKALYNEPERWLEEVGQMADLYHLTLWLKKNGDTWLVERAHIQGTKRFGQI